MTKKNMESCLWPRRRLRIKRRSRQEALEVFSYWLKLHPNYKDVSVTEETKPHRGVVDEFLYHVLEEPVVPIKRRPFVFVEGEHTIKDVLDQFLWIS